MQLKGTYYPQLLLKHLVNILDGCQTIEKFIPPNFISNILNKLFHMPFSFLVTGFIYRRLSIRLVYHYLFLYIGNNSLYKIYISNSNDSLTRYILTIIFLAHLNTTCSIGALMVVMCPSSVMRHASSTISLNIFSQTAGPIWTKLGRNVPWEFLFKICSHNLILSKTVVALATKLNFLSNLLNIFSSGTVGPIMK